MLIVYVVFYSWVCIVLAAICYNTNPTELHTLRLKNLYHKPRGLAGRRPMYPWEIK